MTGRTNSVPGGSNSSFVSTQEFARDSLLGLPDDPIYEILLPVGKENFSTCSLVCKKLYLITHDESFSLLLFDRILRKNYPEQDCSLGFFNACKSCYKKDSNLIKGVYVTKAHDFLKTYSIAISGQKVFWGKTAGKIYQSDPMGKNPSLFSHGHSENVSAMALGDQKLYSGSLNEQVIKIWDLSGKCLGILKTHQGVESLVVYGGNLYSLFPSGMIGKYDLDGVFLGFLQLKDIEGDKPRSIIFANGNLITGHPTHLKVWDFEGTCLKTINTPLVFISTLAIARGKLIARSSDGDACIIDLETWETVGSFKGYRDHISFAANEGDKHYLCAPRNDRVDLLDFNPKDQEVFEELSNLFFRHPHTINTIEAMDRFNRMPKNARSKIYIELYHIIKPSLKNDDFGSGEHAFHSLHGLDSTWTEKGNAILNYLRMGRFNRMSQSEKNKVYGNLYHILKPCLEKDYWGCGEDAFHNLNGLSSAQPEKCLAIQNYLDSEETSG